MSEENKVVFLQGERLYLRPIEEEDLDRCRRWINDPRVRKFLKQSFPLDRIAERAWHERRSRARPPSEIILAIVLNDGDRHIGNNGIHPIDWLNRRGTSGTMIGEPELWGKGYGYEAKELLLEYAFNTLNLHRIDSGALSTNPRSIACLKKSGYVEEGRARQWIYRDGQWVDHVLFGILAEEWRARRRKDGSGKPGLYDLSNRTPC
jgi:RimJ/RimL family protein N-acetyltransferase